jgi:hypothetical protein
VVQREDHDFRYGVGNVVTVRIRRRVQTPNAGSRAHNLMIRGLFLRTETYESNYSLKYKKKAKSTCNSTCPTGSNLSSLLSSPRFGYSISHARLIISHSSPIVTQRNPIGKSYRFSHTRSTQEIPNPLDDHQLLSRT